MIEYKHWEIKNPFDVLKRVLEYDDLHPYH